MRIHQLILHFEPLANATIAQPDRPLKGCNVSSPAMIERRVYTFERASFQCKKSSCHKRYCECYEVSELLLSHTRPSLTVDGRPQSRVPCTSLCKWYVSKILVDDGQFIFSLSALVVRTPNNRLIRSTWVFINRASLKRLPRLP